MTSPQPNWGRLGASIYLPTGLSMVGVGAVSPLIALSARSLGASVAESAFIVGLLAIGGLVGALPAGVLATRFGERRVLIGAMLMDAAAFATAAWAPSVFALGAAVLSAGLAGAVLILARQAYLTTAVPFRYRARALSTLGGVFRMGTFVGPLLGAAVVSRGGLVWAYLMAALVSLAAAVITFTLPELPEPAPSGQPVRLGRMLLAHRRTYATLGLGAAALMLVRASRDAVLPLWGDDIGASAATISLVFALSSAVDMGLFYLGGSIMDRFGRHYVAVPAIVIMGTSFAALPLTHGLVGLVAVAVALGLGNGISAGAVMTLGSDASPEEGRSHFLAGWRLTTGIGQTLGPVMVAAITAVAPLAVACWAIAILGWSGGAWLWKWGRPKPAG